MSRALVTSHSVQGTDAFRRVALDMHVGHPAETGHTTSAVRSVTRPSMKRLPSPRPSQAAGTIAKVGAMRNADIHPMLTQLVLRPRYVVKSRS